MIKPGTIIDNKYLIESVIGVGSYGCVYKALHQQLHRTVALKILNSNVLEESDGAKRFEREGKIMSALQHKNIVAFHGFGVWQGAPYMVMEFVEGTSVSALVAQQQKLPTERAIKIAVQLCEALHAAHSKGIVHRDLKPNNLMLTDAGGKDVLKVIDFGLAKLLPGYGIAAQKLTEAGVTVGTCHYMSPEQCVGGVEVDHRTDIYATGCLLFEMLTATPPYVADDTVAVMFQHVNAPVPRLSDHLPAASAERDALQAVIDRAMAKNPEERYSSAEDMIKDLGKILFGYTRTLAASVKAYQGRSGTALWSKQQLRKKMPIIALSAIILAGASALFAYQQKAHEERETRQSASAMYDGVWVALSRDRAKLTPLAKAQWSAAQSEAVLKADKADHTLTPTQRAQMLHAHIFALFQMNHPENALPYCEQAVALHSKDNLPYAAEDNQFLTRAYEYIGKPEKAEQHYVWMIANVKFPDASSQASTFIEYARLLARLGKYDEARRILSKVSPDEAGSATRYYYFTLGNLNLVDGKYADAAKDFALAQATADNNDLIVFDFGSATAALEMNDRKEMARVLEDMNAHFASAESNGHLFSFPLLKLALGATLRDHEAAKQAANQLCSMKTPIIYAEVPRIENVNRALCTKAIKSAGYTDIADQLRKKFDWAS